MQSSKFGPFSRSREKTREKSRHSAKQPTSQLINQLDCNFMRQCPSCAEELLRPRPVWSHYMSPSAIIEEVMTVRVGKTRNKSVKPSKRQGRGLKQVHVGGAYRLSHHWQRWRSWSIQCQACNKRCFHFLRFLIVWTLLHKRRNYKAGNSTFARCFSFR